MSNSTIDPTIIGAIIGSGITLCGIFFQHIFDRMLLNKQKIIDIDNLKKNREFELKKDNYLFSLNAITDMVNYLMDFTKPGKDYDEFGKNIQNSIGKLFPIDLVADKTTLEPMHNFQKYYFKICMDLMTAKLPVEELIIKRNTILKYQEYYSQKIQENISLIKSNPYQNTDPQHEQFQQFLDEEFKRFSKKNEFYNNELNSINQKLLLIEMNFKRQLSEKLLMINQIINEYIQSARADLGLTPIPSDLVSINSFHDMVRDNLENLFKAVNNFSVDDKNEGESTRKETKS